MVFALLLWSSVAWGIEPQPNTNAVEGEVIGVIDGDTIDVLIDASSAMRLGYPHRKSPLPIRLRLDQVDTPERGQAWANRAKQALSDLVYGKVVRFTSSDIDRYDREVAMVYLDQIWVNAWLIERGHGWAYRQYSKQPTLLCSLENKARVAHAGLWSQPPNTWLPPWIWRKHQPNAVVPTTTLDTCLGEASAQR